MISTSAVTLTNMGALAAREALGTSNAFSVEVVATATSERPVAGRVYYAVTNHVLPTSGSFFSNQDRLGRVRESLEFGYAPSGVSVSKTPLIPADGTYVYLWLEFDGGVVANPASVLSVNVNKL